MQKFGFVMVFLSVAFFQTAFTQTLSDSIAKWFDAKQHDLIIKRYFKAVEMEEELYSKDLFYVGLSLAEAKHYLTAWRVLDKISNSTDLKKRDLKTVKKLKAETQPPAYNANLHYQNGMKLIDESEWNKAEKELLESLKSDAHYTYALSNLLYIATILKDQKKVEHYFTQSKNTNPYNAYIYTCVSSYYSQFEEHKSRALAVLEPLKNINEEQYFLAKAKVYSAQKEYDLAITELKHIHNSKEPAKIQKQIGKYYHYASKYQESNEYLVPYFEATKDQEVVVTMAQNYYNIEDYDESIRLIDYLLPLQPKDSYLPFLKGLCIRDKIGGYPYRNPANLIAASWFEKAVALDSSQARYHQYLAKSLRDGLKREEAIKAYKKAIAIDSLNWDYYDGWWRVIINEDKLREEREIGNIAVPRFEAAYQKDSTNYLIAYGLGMAYKTAKIGLFEKHGIPKEQKAIYYLEKSIELNPECTKCYDELDLIYSYGLEKEKYKNKELELAKKQVKNLPSNGEGYRDLFFIYLNSNQFQMANDVYLEMMKNVPNHWSIEQIQNSIYEHRKDYTWADLPVPYTKSISWKYLDSIANILEGTTWYELPEGCGGVGELHSFDLERKIMKVHYTQPIKWNGEMVSIHLYDIVGTYPNGLRVRLHGEHRKDYNGNVQLWDLIIWNKDLYKWRSYPTRQPYYFGNEMIRCYD